MCHALHRLSGGPVCRCSSTPVGVAIGPVCVRAMARVCSEAAAADVGHQAAGIVQAQAGLVQAALDICLPAMERACAQCGGLQLEGPVGVLLYGTAFIGTTSFLMCVFTPLLIINSTQVLVPGPKNLKKERDSNKFGDTEPAII